MKATLVALFTAILMVGCVRDQITDYYDNGKKKYERTWKGQELDGPVTWWYENGQKRQQINFKDGKKDGPFIVWNENGKEIRQLEFNDIQIDSIFDKMVVLKTKTIYNIKVLIYDFPVEMLVVKYYLNIT